jgi:hypothetical protein
MKNLINLFFFIFFSLNINIFSIEWLENISNQNIDRRIFEKIEKDKVKNFIKYLEEYSYYTEINYKYNGDNFRSIKIYKTTKEKNNTIYWLGTHHDIPFKIGEYSPKDT